MRLILLWAFAVLLSVPVAAADVPAKGLYVQAYTLDVVTKDFDQTGRGAVLSSNHLAASIGQAVSLDLTSAIDRLVPCEPDISIAEATKIRALCYRLSGHSFTVTFTLQEEISGDRVRIVSQFSPGFLKGSTIEKSVVVSLKKKSTLLRIPTEIPTHWLTVDILPRRVRSIATNR